MERPPSNVGRPHPRPCRERFRPSPRLRARVSLGPVLPPCAAVPCHGDPPGPGRGRVTAPVTAPAWHPTPASPSRLTGLAGGGRAACGACEEGLPCFVPLRALALSVPRTPGRLTGACSPLPTPRLPGGPGWVPSTARLPAGHPLCLRGETLVLPGRTGVQPRLRPPATIAPHARSPGVNSSRAGPGSSYWNRREISISKSKSTSVIKKTHTHRRPAFHRCGGD